MEMRSTVTVRCGAVLYVYVKASVCPSGEVHGKLACGAVAEGGRQRGHSPFTFRTACFGDWLAWLRLVACDFGEGGERGEVVRWSGQSMATSLFWPGLAWAGLLTASPPLRSPPLV